MCTSTWSSHGPHLGQRPGGSKDLPGPISLKTISPTTKSYHFYMGPTNLTVYNLFGWICRRSNALVHLNGCKTGGAMWISERGGGPFGWTIMWVHPHCERCTPGALHNLYIYTLISPILSPSFGFPSRALCPLSVSEKKRFALRIKLKRLFLFLSKRCLTRRISSFLLQITDYCILYHLLISIIAFFLLHLISVWFCRVSLLSFSCFLVCMFSFVFCMLLISWM